MIKKMRKPDFLLGASSPRRHCWQSVSNFEDRYRCCPHRTGRL